MMEDIHIEEPDIGRRLSRRLLHRTESMRALDLVAVSFSPALIEADLSSRSTEAL